MNEVTLTVLQGADRGKVFRALSPPITVGREEGNTIQLNDERISRCHLKIQDDNSRLVMTDLDSTNGTKVNGNESHLRILRHGDLIMLGRSVLLVGTQEEIAARMASLRRSDDSSATSSHDQMREENSDFDFSSRPTCGSLSVAMGLEEPPELPQNLTPSQAAQISEVLEYVHLKIQKIVSSAEMDEQRNQVKLSLGYWQQLLDAQVRLSSMLRHISDPE